MINDNTIISSFNDRPTLLEWLKKVEEALKSDTATGVSVENPSVNSYIFKITFADGKTIASEPVKFPDSVAGVSISNNHLIITTQGGIREDLGVINPYADTIVLNSGTNTTEIKNNAKIEGNLQVNSSAEFRGNLLFGGSTISIQGMTKQNGILGTNANGQIAFKEISGGTPLYLHKVKKNDGNTISFLSTFDESIKTSSKTGNFPALVLTCSNVDSFKFTTTLSSAPISGYYYINYDADGAGSNTYDLNQTNVEKDSVLRFI